MNNASIPDVDPDLFAVSPGLGIDLHSSRSSLLGQRCVRESIGRLRGNLLKQASIALKGGSRCRIDVSRAVPNNMTGSCPIEADAPPQSRARFIRHQLIYQLLVLARGPFLEQ